MSTITTTSDERRVIESIPHQLLIGGEWRDGENGSLPVQDPATGDVIAEVADASPRDAAAALDAAVEAAPTWAAYPPRERGEILRRAYETIVSRADDLALLMTLEMGKPLAESRSEIIYGAEFLRWFSEEAVRIDGRYATAPNGNGRLLTMRQPVGPCLLITPWNFPLAMGTRKVGPAVAAGCTMVVKPAQQTPLSMVAFAKILEECGLPAGVLNLVTTSSASSATGPLVADPRLRKLSFTGSTETGRSLMSQASQTMLRRNRTFDTSSKSIALPTSGSLSYSVRLMGIFRRHRTAHSNSRRAILWRFSIMTIRSRRMRSFIMRWPSTHIPMSI